MTTRIQYIMFEQLFGQERQTVSIVFHIPIGFAHSSVWAGGLCGFSTDHETVYRNCLLLCKMGRKTWLHGDSHGQNYAVCGSNLAKINMIYHSYAPGLLEYSSNDKMAKYERLCHIFIHPSLDGTYYGMALSVRPSVRHER